jgi:hypothetical protein
MPYRKVGFVRRPRGVYLPQYAAKVYNAFGSTFDVDVARCVKSLGDPKIMLKNFFFERILLLNDPKLNSDPDLKLAFTMLLIDFLYQCGFVDVLPSEIDYVTDPVLKADDLLDLMLATRMPSYKADSMAGEWSTIDTLMCFFPEVIRRTALIIEERKRMAVRFRQWLGSIGFKLMTTSSDQLSQTEKSFLVVYGCTKHNTKGYVNQMPALPIPPVQTEDPLVLEAGALATACCLPGPCINHMKMVSNATLEELVFYYGPHVAELKTHVGFVREYGPFRVFDTTPEDSVPWDLSAQIYGITSQSASILLKPEGQPPYTLKVPLPRYEVTNYGATSLYPDVPGINLYLTDQRDICRFWWDYPSKWRGRRISSLLDGGSMDYALCDMAVNAKTAGGMQIESTDLSGAGICLLTSAAEVKVKGYDGRIMEEYILPGSVDLERTPVNMAAFYSRFGSTELIPAFAESLEVPWAWFRSPAPRVVDYVCAMEGLSLEQRYNFTFAIELCHNCARYERLTGKVAPINRMQYIKTMLAPGKLVKA